MGLGAFVLEEPQSGAQSDSGKLKRCQARWPIASMKMPFGLGRPGATPRAESRGAGAPARNFPIAVLHLMVLAGFAVSQPLYDLVGRHPTYLIDMEVGLPAILWLVALVSFAAPAAWLAILWAAGRLLPRARSALYAVSAYAILALLALPL